MATNSGRGSSRLCLATAWLAMVDVDCIAAPLAFRAWRRSSLGCGGGAGESSLAAGLASAHLVGGACCFEFAFGAFAAVDLCSSGGVIGGDLVQLGAKAGATALVQRLFCGPVMGADGSVAGKRAFVLAWPWCGCITWR